jgi:signal transduction histidine kinase
MPPRRPWSELPLVLRFLAAGGMVMLAAMLLIGVWITARIEQSVVDNTASAAALYLESFVSPLSQELASSDTLSDPAMRALQEVFSSTGMGERIVSFKIWKHGGLVVHASDPDIIGNRFPPSEELQAAWRGQVSGSFSDLDDAESAAEAALGLPLLEVYSPIHEVWSGEIIAVAEFYEVATELEQDLADARRTSWLLVAAVFTVSGVLLLGIVRSGGRTIDRQRAMLQAQIAESREIAAQNADLRQRAIGATARATAQTEASLRRASADLHDGPAQLIALAAMRLESVVPDTEPGRQEAAALRDALQSALTEIRTISRGLSLPDLGGLPLADVARRAVEAHQRQTESRVQLAWRGPEDPGCDDSFRICLYRFLQEALSNAARHAGDASISVSAEAAPGALTASVSDAGPGFDPAAAALRTDGGQGLAGLRDRAESIGGSLDVVTARGAGTTLILTLPLGKGDNA